MSVAFHVAARYLSAGVFSKTAFTYSEALGILGFPSGATPTEAEVNRVYREKVRDVIQEDPDAAKDQEAMKALNIAKDTLTGQLTPDRGPGPGGFREEDAGPRQKYEPPPAPREEKVTFDEAKAKGRIPADTKWLFVTDSQHSGYSSDEFTNSTTGWVACGETDSHWVLVTVEHHYYSAQSYFSMNIPQSPKDIWSIHTMERPKTTPVPTAAELYKHVLKAWEAFELLDKKFNSKVLDAKGWHFSDKKPAGRKTTIKMLVSQETGVEFTGKMSVEIAYKASHERGDQTPAGYYNRGEYSQPYQLEIVINGREHTLSVPDMQILDKTFRIGGKRFVDRVFGDYPEHSRPKSLTRNRDGKEIMSWMAEKLPHLPDWVREGLIRAAAPPAEGAKKSPRRSRYSYERNLGSLQPVEAGLFGR